MRVQFWGVRGSIPAPGPETNRYGGNTSCVSVRSASGELVIIDMGTGLMHLGNALLATEFGKGQGKATILLSHAHWDHIQGLGFFAPVFIPGNHFTLRGHGKSSSMLEGILEGQMNPNFSPLYTLKNLGATFDVRAVVPGEPFAAGSIRVTARPNPHGSTTALAFRLEEDGRSFVYASDAGYPDGGPSQDVLDLYRGATVMLHDATYTPADQATRRNRGFSSYEQAADAAIAARVGTLVTFHYDQDYADTDVDALRDACRAYLDAHGGKNIELVAAAEGMELDV
ncbi:MAG: MBL fold metallo-hydrolase [Kofleriaceae bacterium]|nr:MAG: MBL fold metallo-hydrolase [Kofleriaceae bacterium]MBZ0236474.1 MBL fold metallo-hydrolase [Kofleriaceae bacterium]